MADTSMNDRIETLEMQVRELLTRTDIIERVLRKDVGVIVPVDMPQATGVEW